MRKDWKRMGSQKDEKQIEKEWEMDRKRTNEGFFPLKNLRSTCFIDYYANPRQILLIWYEENLQRLIHNALYKVVHKMNTRARMILADRDHIGLFYEKVD